MRDRIQLIAVAMVMVGTAIMVAVMSWGFATHIWPQLGVPGRLLAIGVGLIMGGALAGVMSVPPPFSVYTPALPKFLNENQRDT